MFSADRHLHDLSQNVPAVRVGEIAQRSGGQQRLQHLPPSFQVEFPGGQLHAHVVPLVHERDYVLHFLDNDLALAQGHVAQVSQLAPQSFAQQRDLDQLHSFVALNLALLHQTLDGARIEKLQRRWRQLAGLQKKHITIKLEPNRFTVVIHFNRSRYIQVKFNKSQ